MSDFLRIACCYAAVCMIAIPAFLAVNSHVRRSLVADSLNFITTVSALSIASYFLFFAYVYSTQSGIILNTIFCLAMVSLLFINSQFIRLSDMYFIAIPAMIGGVYISCAYVFAPDSIIDLPASFYFERWRPHDHLIPLMFADAVYHKLPGRTGVDQWGWYFSDRPPLQTSFTLAFSPLWHCFDQRFVYQALSTFLQTSTIAAAWVLCKALRFDQRETRFAVLALATSGFNFSNSIYAWPKLLAATFFLMACAILAEPYLDRRRLSPFEVSLFGLTVSLALLSHGAVAFSIVGLCVILIYYGWYLFSIKTFLLCFFCVSILYAPWAAYTKFVDPNDNRLIRMHLTVSDWNAKGPILPVMIKTYQDTSFKDWLFGRKWNLRVMVADPSVDGLIKKLVVGIYDARRRVSLTDNSLAGQWHFATDNLRYDLLSLATVLRIDQRDEVVRNLFILNLALPAFFLGIWWPGIRKRLLTSGLVVLSTVTLFGAIAFVVLEFPPGAANAISVSFAIIIGMVLVSAIVLFRISERVAWNIFWTSLALTILVWVVLLPGPAQEVTHSLNTSAAAVGTLLTIMLIFTWKNLAARDNANMSTAVDTDSGKTQ